MRKYHIILIPLIGPHESRDVHEHSGLADYIEEIGFPKVVIDTKRAFVLDTTAGRTGTYLEVIYKVTHS